MVRIGESKMVLANHRRSLLLTATRETIRARVYGMNPLLILRPKDVERLLAELIEWRGELLDNATRLRVPQHSLRRQGTLADRSAFCD
jgi:hypothetical protein